MFKEIFKRDLAPEIAKHREKMVDGFNDANTILKTNHIPPALPSVDFMVFYDSITGWYKVEVMVRGTRIIHWIMPTHSLEEK